MAEKETFRMHWLHKSLCRYQAHDHHCHSHLYLLCEVVAVKNHTQLWCLHEGRQLLRVLKAQTHRETEQQQDSKCGNRLIESYSLWVQQDAQVHPFCWNFGNNLEAEKLPANTIKLFCRRPSRGWHQTNQRCHWQVKTQSNSIWKIFMSAKFHFLRQGIQPTD